MLSRPKRVGVIPVRFRTFSTLHRNMIDPAFRLQIIEISGQILLVKAYSYSYEKTHGRQ